jgi:signal transduction histidine kinase/DNA-binding response OmpR family regulator
MGIVEEHGVLWLSTDRGIVRYEPLAAGSTLQRFTRHDGLVSLQAQPSAVLKASDGRIFVGTTGGFNMFYPYQIKANSVTPRVYVTQLDYFNQQDDSLLCALLPEKVVLNHDEARMLTLSFAALSYYSPAENQYEYRMDGFDRDWNRTSGAAPKATYTNLPAGTYTFRVRASNSDGVWSKDEATLTIVVNPPLWWTWWARMLYAIIAVLAIWYYVHIRLKRAERKHQQELQRVNEQKEKESREARLAFFTMVAHEIRTPVSLIIGPLEQLKKTINDKQLDIVDRNAHRLLELVNQLLDFRKVEQHSLVMHFASHNVNELLHSISERFEPTFEQGGKQFTTVYPPERFTAIIDREGITKVISNLLTNANKYAKSRVELRCVANADDDRFVIEVTDDGAGIRQEDMERIFEPFFQSQGNKPGTGIGLSIVKRIVDLHHGTIGVQSVVGQGSTFTVSLPAVQALDSDAFPNATKQQHLLSDQVAPSDQAVPSDQAAKRPDDQAPTILIVDDNDDMVGFLASHFARHYTVLTAADGIEALDLVARHEVSIIVSDWMMPRMDGADFCRQIRRNPLTSHIPFLMLTAKADNQSKTEGMNVGADIYIEKPFSVEYLEACIANILQMRRLLMQKVSTQPFEDVAQMGTNPVDNELLKRMNQIIEDNVANADLNVNFLAEQLNISRSGLFAKIKSLTDVTPNEMIQVVRLKRAARLLLESNYLVSEVGYMVGFSSPSYFSKCFQKQFGMKPGDYVKKGFDGAGKQ